MKILLCANIGKTNQYIEEISKAYQKQGHDVIFGSKNFFFSNFIPDIVHIQWPEALYRWNYKSKNKIKIIKLIEERLLFYSKNKIPIVYTVHNIIPHENVSDFDKNIFNIIASQSNIIIHHGKKSITLAKKVYPKCKKAKHIIAPHGPYPFVKKDSLSARKHYNIPMNKYVLLNFGLQRSYKGPAFINSVHKKSKTNTFLFTIGPPKVDFYIKNKWISFIIKFYKKIIIPYWKKTFSFLFKNKKTILREVPNDEIPIIMAAIDIVFLGHKKGLNSGLLALAASYGKPVIFPNIGNFKNQLDGWDWFETYDPGNTDSAIKALKKIYKRIKNNNSVPGQVTFNNNNWLKNNSWDNHVKIIVESIKKYKNEI